MKKLTFLIIFLFLLLSQSLQAADFSYSTDFDGVGNGSGFTIHVPDPSSHGPRYSNDDRGNNDSDETFEEDQTYLRETYEDQLAAAQKRAEAEELRQEIERVRRENNVHELKILLERLKQYEADEPSAIQRMQYTQKVLQLEKKFNQAREEYMDTLSSYRERMAWSIDHIVVPPPPHPLHYKSIMFWGLWSTPEEAQEASEAGLKNTFTNEPFDEVFAFGSSNASDFFRVGLDHFLGQFNLLSSATRENLLEKLKGATVDEVVCHSNGCRIVEVLIATGLLKVNKLRILGGDDVLFDLSHLKKLKEEKEIQEVSVYAMKGDIVPLVSTGWEIMDYMKQIGNPLQSFQNKRHDPTYQVLGITEKPKFDPDSTFQVHMLTYPAGSSMNFVEKHLYKNYARVINGWRMSNCLKPNGAMDQRCIFY